MELVINMRQLLDMASKRLEDKHNIVIPNLGKGGCGMAYSGIQFAENIDRTADNENNK